jgi:hypothetical protein
MKKQLIVTGGDVLVQVTMPDNASPHPINLVFDVKSTRTN